MSDFDYYVVVVFFLEGVEIVVSLSLCFAITNIVVHDEGHRAEVNCEQNGQPSRSYTVSFFFQI